jgi:hypothetical protein
VFLAFLHLALQIDTPIDAPAMFYYLY